MEKSRCLSRPLVLIGWAVIDLKKWQEVMGQSPQSAGGPFTHREPQIPPLEAALRRSELHRCFQHQAFTPNSGCFRIKAHYVIMSNHMVGK